MAQVWELPFASMLGVEQLNAICPWSDGERTGCAKVEEYGLGIVEQGKNPQGAVGGDQVEVGHAASEQGVSLAEVVADVEARYHRGESPAGLFHGEELGDDVAQCLDVVVAAQKCDLRDRVAQHAGGDRVALGMVGIQEAVW